MARLGVIPILRDAKAQVTARCANGPHLFCKMALRVSRPPTVFRLQSFL